MARHDHRFVETVEAVIDHDTWNTSPARLPPASAVSPGSIWDVLPFDGARNPSGRSSTSHKVFLTYRTAANDWKPKVGIAESAAEAAVGLEAAMSPSTFDLAFQPLAIEYEDEGKSRVYTHDLMITHRNGKRTLVFVRNAASLEKPRTDRQISAIAAGTPKHAADGMILVNADDYTRQRRENLMRMHHFVFHPDPEADEALLEVARTMKSLYYMQDLFPHAPVSQPRAFAACHRLIARGHLRANLDNVLWEHSRVWVAA